MLPPDTFPYDADLACKPACALLEITLSRVVHMQTLPAVCVAAEVVHDWDPRATLHLQEAWPETIQLRPAQIVAITPEYLAKLWQVLTTAP